MKKQMSTKRGAPGIEQGVCGNERYLYSLVTTSKEILSGKIADDWGGWPTTSLSYSVGVWTWGGICPRWAGGLPRILSTRHHGADRTVLGNVLRCYDHFR